MHCQLCDNRLASQESLLPPGLEKRSRGNIAATCDPPSMIGELAARPRPTMRAWTVDRPIDLWSLLACIIPKPPIHDDDMTRLRDQIYEVLQARSLLCADRMLRVFCCVLLDVLLVRITAQLDDC